MKTWALHYYRRGTPGETCLHTGSLRTATIHTGQHWGGEDLTTAPKAFGVQNAEKLG
ncbi:MAG: hypothetical protein JWR26_2887 [Pedosphaera sp.]|nr:hypothetical protein [Pedosphaera sp.]